MELIREGDEERRCYLNSHLKLKTHEVMGECIMDMEKYAWRLRDQSHRTWEGS